MNGSPKLKETSKMKTQLWRRWREAKRTWLPVSRAQPNQGNSKTWMQLSPLFQKIDYSTSWKTFWEGIQFRLAAVQLWTAWIKNVYEEVLSNDSVYAFVDPGTELFEKQDVSKTDSERFVTIDSRGWISGIEASMLDSLIEDANEMVPRAQRRDLKYIPVLFEALSSL